MADLAQGNFADVVLNPGESVRVSTGGQATVASAFGAPAGTVTLNANTQVFGPYSVLAKLRVTAVSGSANYAQPTQVPVTANPATGEFSPPVSGAGNQIMTAGVSGSATEWQASATGKEGWLFQPSGLTGTASFSLDASNDGATVAETLWTVALYPSTDNNKNCYPFPQGIGIGYAKYRWRCTNDGGGTHNIARGF